MKFKVGDKLKHNLDNIIIEIIAVINYNYFIKFDEEFDNAARYWDEKTIEENYSLYKPSIIKPIEKEVNKYDQDIRNFFKEGDHNKKSVWAIKRS